jgi:hypothetical protein
MLQVEATGIEEEEEEEEEDNDYIWRPYYPGIFLEVLRYNIIYLLLF